MNKFVAVLSIVSALSLVAECQDMTSLVFQALGMDPPPMPPVMPQTLREHLYPIEQRQREMFRQRQMQLQKQRYLAYLSAQKQKQAKANPYSAPYRSTGQYLSSARPKPRENSVISPANMIRQPGPANSVDSYKGNPYSISYQDGAARKTTYNNPYSASRSPASSSRNRAGMSRVPLSPQAAKMYKTYQTMKVMREQPRRITDAKAAGCRLPVDNTAASVLLFGTCRNPTARMVCQAEFMTCMNIGMAPMCCPHGMNSLAMDTINYVNKLQHFVSEMA